MTIKSIITCDLCKKDIKEGGKYQNFTFAAKTKDNKITGFYPESQICEECTILVTKALKISIQEETEEKPKLEIIKEDS